MEFAVVTDLVILAGALAFVGWPLANPARADEESTAREKRRVALDDEKERLLAGLADLDHDRATGKMEDADHLALSSKLKVEAARVLREIDLNEGRRLLKPGEEPESAPAPKAVATAKKSAPHGKPVDRDDAPTVPGMKPRSLDDVESDEVSRLKKQLDVVEAERKRLEAENQKNEERVVTAFKKLQAHRETSDSAGVNVAEGPFCTKCGRQARSTTDKFCGRCGTALPDDIIN